MHKMSDRMVQSMCKQAVVLVGVGAALVLGQGCSRDHAGSPTGTAQTVLAAEAPGQPEVVPTNRVEGEAFSLEWKPGSGEAGGAIKGELVLIPKAPFKCNIEYPYKLKVTAQAVGLTKAEVTKPDIAVDAKRVVIPVTYTMPASPQVIDGHLAFSVCTDDKCLIERTQLKMTTQAL